MKSSIELIRLIAVILIVFTHTRNNLTHGVTYFIIEKIPTFGTAILSIVSGYLYYEVSRLKPNLFFSKVKSLLVPYLIANGLILFIVLFLNYVVGYNALNRLTYDYHLITEGLFAFHSPPINPPTYFVRDIFVIFSIIALATQREWKTLWILIPLLLFGTLILRTDIALLFVLGISYASSKSYIDKKWLTSITAIATIVIGFFFIDLLKFPLAFLVFLLLIDWQFAFYNTSRYSYLLHLYHSPIIVISYPILKRMISDSLGLILMQILVALLGAYLLFRLSGKYKFLSILSGGR